MLFQLHRVDTEVEASSRTRDRPRHLLIGLAAAGTVPPITRVERLADVHRADMYPLPGSENTPITHVHLPYIEMDLMPISV